MVDDRDDSRYCQGGASGFMLTVFAGEKLLGIMRCLTKDKFRGFLTGFGVTVKIQSSLFPTVLEAILAGAVMATFQQSLAEESGCDPWH